MKLAIIGSRKFSNKERFDYKLEPYKDKVTLVISGGAEGADTFASNWAKENNIPIIVHLPDWNKYGKAAGAIRNRLIVNECDELIAFWDGKSKGTKISIDMAKDQRKRYDIIYF